MTEQQIERILSYWFGLTPEQWWRDQSLDEDIRRRFLDLWEAERGKPASAFLGSAREALAAVLLFDQFPRNMFRDTPQSFATDGLGLRIAREAILGGYDAELGQDERLFVYVPFQHSERLEDQDRAVELFAALGDAQSLRSATMHRDLIARFGRFPHRNIILGREPTAAERAAGNPVPW